MYYTEAVAHVCSIHSAYFNEGNYGVFGLIVQHCHYFINMYVFMYRKVASSRLSQLVAHPRIFRRPMKGKFDTYVL